MITTNKKKHLFCVVEHTIYVYNVLIYSRTLNQILITKANQMETITMSKTEFKNWIDSSIRFFYGFPRYIKNDTYFMSLEAVNGYLLPNEKPDFSGVKRIVWVN